MKKFLLVATVTKIHVNVFHIPTLKMMKEKGYEVHVAARNDYENPEECIIPYCDKHYDIPFERSPIKKNNLESYKALKNIIDSNDYEIIHCHTPVGGALTRLAARGARNKGTKVLYTAHGFHFYDGAPIINWLTFYPVEKILSKYTDTIITINKEDFNRAQNFNSKQVAYIPGIGIDVKKYTGLNFDRDKKHQDLGISEENFIITSVGELNDNKNHEVIIKALGRLQNKNIHYIICGDGDKKGPLKRLAKEFNLENNVHLLGYRTDIPEILSISDVFAFPSKREGLGLGAIEAMASGLPLITSNIHGIKDYSVHGTTGFNYDPSDIEGFAHGIKKIYSLTESERETISINNKNLARGYDLKVVEDKMEKIYSF